jgi:hypothetical protein
MTCIVWNQFEEEQDLSMALLPAWFHTESSGDDTATTFTMLTAVTWRKGLRSNY